MPNLRAATPGQDTVIYDVARRRFADHSRFTARYYAAHGEIRPRSRGPLNNTSRAGSCPRRSVRAKADLGPDAVGIGSVSEDRHLPDAYAIPLTSLLTPTPIDQQT
jgi:hypothetical protein